MASNNELNLKITLDNGQFKVQTADAKKSIEGIGTAGKAAGAAGASGIGKMFNAMTMLKTAAKGFVALEIVKFLYNIGKTAVGTASQFEMYDVAFRTMLGSAEKSTKLLNQIREFAAATPFQLPGLVEASKKLVSFGVDAEDVIPSLRMLGDAAMGDAQSLETLTDVFGKVKVSGRASMEDINRIADRGVGIYAALAETMGVNESQVRKMVETGQVGFPQIQAAFRQMTSEGGRYFNMMATASQTLSGTWSTLKDSVSLALMDMGQKATPAIKNLVKSFALGTTGAGIFQKAIGLTGVVLGKLINSIALTVTGFVWLTNVAQEYYNKVNKWAQGVRMRDAMSQEQEISGIQQTHEMMMRNQSARGDMYREAYASMQESESAIVDHLEHRQEIENSMAQIGQEILGIQQQQVQVQEQANALANQAASTQAGGTGGAGETDAQIKARLKAKADATKKWSDYVLGVEGDTSAQLVEQNNQRLQQIDEAQRKGYISEELANRARVTSHGQLEEEMTNITRQNVMKRVEAASTVLSTTSSLVGQLGQLLQQQYQNETAEIDNHSSKQLEIIANKYAEEKAYIDQNISDQTQKDAALKALDEKRAREEKLITDKAEKEKKQIQRDAAKRQKEFQVYEVILTTPVMAAQSYKALAGIPIVGPALGFAAAAAATALGLKKLQLIKQTPLPEAAEGMYSETPAIFGEAGPELAFPLSSDRGRKAMAFMSDALLTQMSQRQDKYQYDGADMGNSQPVYNITVQGSVIDKDGFLNSVGESIERIQRQSGQRIMR